MEQYNINTIDKAGGNLSVKLTRKRRLRRLALSGELKVRRSAVRRSEGRLYKVHNRGTYRPTGHTFVVIYKRTFLSIPSLSKSPKKPYMFQ